MNALLLPYSLVGVVPLKLTGESTDETVDIPDAAIDNNQYRNDVFYNNPATATFTALISPLDATLPEEIRIVQIQAIREALRFAKRNPQLDIFIISHTDIYTDYAITSLHTDIDFSEIALWVTIGVKKVFKVSQKEELVSGYKRTYQKTNMSLSGAKDTQTRGLNSLKRGMGK